MSQSSHRVGRMSARGLIEHADRSYCDSHEGVQGWDTADLGDFVQGMLEATIEALAELKPEIMREVDAQQFERIPRQMHLRRIQ